MKSQNEMILAHLRKGRKITAIDALKLFNCFRLASRINNLRNGYLKPNEQLHSVMIQVNGKRIAQYKLTKIK